MYKKFVMKAKLLYLCNITKKMSNLIFIEQ